ncbi:glycine cleavage system H protein [Pseudohongiella nitratireducens]|uniref:Glycine cleavage system H protein n=1 Tax=Pseudohongiella nitratireducens TaxID=1768907 RepID=A0A917GKY2_9GAMM|nr:glycine cleavage system protein GcvH [Pseudohongiella nitratireducens]MDF1622219.1 glycine cleavage system protein GcvH [Pseudohongiella nitratireducens]GGG50534.1 glycine cleavage system H protein [Pseudohongiella nitratireducens]
MSDLPSELHYTATHEWIRVEEDHSVTIGITDHAQDLLGDIVFIELPEEGSTVAAKDELSVIESVKAASDIYAPVSGEIIAVNEDLADAPETVNSSPYEEGWICRILPSNPAELEELLDADTYAGMCE